MLRRSPEQPCQKASILLGFDRTVRVLRCVPGKVSPYPWSPVKVSRYDIVNKNESVPMTSLAKVSPYPWHHQDLKKWDKLLITQVTELNSYLKPFTWIKNSSSPAPPCPDFLYLLLPSHPLPPSTSRAPSSLTDTMGWGSVEQMWISSGPCRSFQTNVSGMCSPVQAVSSGNTQSTLCAKPLTQTGISQRFFSLPAWALCFLICQIHVKSGAMASN